MFNKKEKTTHAAKVDTRIEDDLIILDPKNTEEEVKNLYVIARTMEFEDYNYSRTFAKGGCYYVVFDGRRDINKISRNDLILFRNTFIVLKKIGIVPVLKVSDGTNERDLNEIEIHQMIKKTS